tara:strand:- start:91 stop:555 length:465 start_codon:yes stop_codon:yes gene_type:complete
VFFLNKYIGRLLIFSLIIISFYNIFSIFILSFSFKIDGFLIKTINYLPYKHSIFFQKPLKFSKKDIQSNSPDSKKLYYLINSTEKKSALDYTYWETKILHQIKNESVKNDFERNFINLAVLSKNNLKKKKSLKLYYLRNVPRFSKEVGDIINSN